MYAEHAGMAAVLIGVCHVRTKQRYSYTTWLAFQSAVKSYSHLFRVACNKSAVSLLESGE